MRIFLIGMPGSGKTYWMKHFATALQWTYIDLDHYLEAQHSKSIAQLFAQGEPFFRNKEKTALQELIDQNNQNMLIATGGGLPCHFDNMQRMKAAGLVVYLNTSIPDIIYNLRQSTNTRPLLSVNSEKELSDKILDLYESRKEIYEQAHLKIDPNTISVSTFVDLVKKHFHKSN